MRELEGKAAIVTGAARNIGRAIALSLAEGGANVALVSKSDGKGLKTVAAEIAGSGGRALVLQADITKESDVKRMVAETLKTFGRLDILVNNATLRLSAPVEDITLGQWRAVMAVTLEGPFLCAREALPALSEAKGTIVNIGGLTAYTGAVHRAPVVAAKAGLGGLTKALAAELADRGITVNCVAPGTIATAREEGEPEHHKARNIPVGRRGQPEEVAALVRYLVGPDARYITGQTIHVSGGTYMP